MAFNTGNPIGSTDPRDFSDNSENLDRAVNNTASATWTDRLGNTRTSLAGQIGYIGTGVDGAIEDYAAGQELTTFSTIIRYSGEFYRPAASATLPYTTTATTPDVDANLVSVGDATLRQDLADNSAGSGADLLAHTGTSDTVTEALDRRTIYVGTVAEVEALSLPAGTNIYLTDELRNGEFVFMSGDRSANITSDPQQGVWIAPSSDPTGASGAWMRRFNGLTEGVSVLWFGAKGDLSDDTAAIQAALDYCPIGTSVHFPKGNYKVTGTDPYLLSLTRNVSLKGDGQRASKIQALDCAPTSSILEVNFSDAGGFSDVRGWTVEGLQFSPDDGLHGIEMTGGFATLTCSINNCNLGSGVGGYAFYDSAERLAHSTITNCTITAPLYLQCGDANEIHSNLFLGERRAITFDVSSGVRNNTVYGNTIVTRDGALHVVNGSEIRFINNQVEQNLSFGANTSVPAASVYIEGAARISTNVVIEDNNFGGGTNVDYSVYLDNAQHCVITKNHFVACDIDDVYMTANSKFNIVKFDNTVRTQVANPRTDPFFKLQITTNNAYNIGVPIDFSGGGSFLANGWTISNPAFFKSEDGYVHQISGFNSGTSAAGTNMGRFPNGIRPLITESLPVHGSGVNIAGSDWVQIINTNGDINTGSSLSGNSNVRFPPFRSEINSTDF